MHQEIEFNARGRIVDNTALSVESNKNAFAGQLAVTEAVVGAKCCWRVVIVEHFVCFECKASGHVVELEQLG